MTLDLTTFFGVLDESYFLVIPLLAIWLYYKKDKNVFSFATAVIVLYVIANVLKVLIAEPRPCAGLPGCESGFGFPSDHATTLTGPYLFFIYNKYLRFLYPIWLVLVLYGRIFLDQHTLIQVAAGVVIGAAVGYAIYRYRDRINGLALGILARLGIRPNM